MNLLGQSTEKKTTTDTHEAILEKLERGKEAAARLIDFVNQGNDVYPYQ